jgi:hypothetical protein
MKLIAIEKIKKNILLVNCKLTFLDYLITRVFFQLITICNYEIYI